MKSFLSVLAVSFLVAWVLGIGFVLSDLGAELGFDPFSDSAPLSRRVAAVVLVLPWGLLLLAVAIVFVVGAACDLFDCVRTLIKRNWDIRTSSGTYKHKNGNHTFPECVGHLLLPFLFLGFVILVPDHVSLDDLRAVLGWGCLVFFAGIIAFALWCGAWDAITRRRNGRQ